jgi:RNA polymerase sigma-70 factor (ECF subfamily)
MTTSAHSEAAAGDDLDAAKVGDSQAFDRLIAPFRRELLAHCYRMLGSAHDADDALQNTLLRAWNGLPRFAGRSSLRTWLYKIATNCCFALIERNGRQHIPVDPAALDGGGSATAAEPAWLEPYPYDIDEYWSPATAIERRESMELAFVTAFQHLPSKERAALLLRDVVGFTANETAAVLDTSVAAVTSRLQRARTKVGGRLPEHSQRDTLRAIGDERLQALVTAYVDAWERGDAAAIVALVTEDATFSMPPQTTWLRGRGPINQFLHQAPLHYQWRLVPTRAGGQLAFGCYTRNSDTWAAHSVDVITLRGDQIARITAFMKPNLLTHLGLPACLDP